jgi:diguanylate cyclase (GGDEF)-like protein
VDTDRVRPGGASVARSAYHDRLRLSARRSCLAGGVVLLFAFPVWSVFDWFVLPARAVEFSVVRAVFEVPIALAVLALSRPSIGGRWPEATAFVTLALPQLAIAWMIPRSQGQLTAYLLGFSLIMFASAVVVAWRWQLTIWLTAFTLSATAVAAATSPAALPRSSVATIVFYLGTAGLVAVVGQYHRYRAGWAQFSTELALQEEQSRSEALLQELRKLSAQDPLTGVANRRAWDGWVQREWNLSRRTGRPLSVVLCDFDRFKEVNDSYGHAVGDHVLRSGAEALQLAARSTDLVARLGGDEFIVGCPDSDLTAATSLAHRLAASARGLTWPHDVLMTVSFGVAQMSDDDETVAALFARADAALYEAKSSRDAVVSAT